MYVCADEYCVKTQRWKVRSEVIHHFKEVGGEWYKNPSQFELKLLEETIIAVVAGGVSAFEKITLQRRKCSFIFFRRVIFWWCAHHDRVGSLWENRQCLICYDMNTQLDHRVQILQSAVRCQAALRGSSSGSEPVTHHIKITGENKAFSYLITSHYRKPLNLGVFSNSTFQTRSCAYDG